MRDATTNTASTWRAVAYAGLTTVAVALAGCGGGSATHDASPATTSVAPIRWRSMRNVTARCRPT